MSDASRAAAAPDGQRPRRPTKDELLAAAGKTVPDLIKPDLTVLFVGINPGLYTAAIGHHFGRPGNRFWPALFESGFTPRLLTPCEEAELLSYGLGLTNLVARATRAASELAAAEFRAGRRHLEEKAACYEPRWLAFVGIGAYRTAFQRPTAPLGRQQETVGSAGVWVLPSTSGLNANHTPRRLAELFREFREAAFAGD
ncbi:MAG: G/U mismatch-specific DNA glycosylase [Gaiellales bacterium]|nr:G/U mismatch-specific DNA glycosylase [Gaiellales bacterium]